MDGHKGTRISVSAGPVADKVKEIFAPQAEITNIQVETRIGRLCSISAFWDDIEFLQSTRVLSAESLNHKPDWSQLEL